MYGPYKFHLQILFFIAFLLIGAEQIIACDCFGITGVAALQNAESVFIGRVIEIQRIDDPQTKEREPRIIVTFQANRMWKGEKRKEITLYTVENRWSCDGFQFEETQEYLVFAQLNTPAMEKEFGKIKNSLGVTTCGGTRPIALATDQIQELDLALQQDQIIPKSPYVLSKANKTQKVLEVVSKLERLARINSNKANGKYVNGYLSQASINEIGRLVKELPNSEQLTKLALICGHIAYPQIAGQQGYDEVFDRAMWDIAYILAGRTDSDAITGLELLKRSFGTYGHSAEEMNELIEKQRKLVESSKNKRR
ncbi:MAG TPA: hypothetical protein VEF04_19380 [Blastocatellia bacterium]|nr:hypothetical protein [Blastocatellia bacterium]